MILRPLPVLTILSVPILIMLAILGNWQWDRYVFKKNLEAHPRIEILQLSHATIAVRDFQHYQLKAKTVSKPIAVQTSENGKFGARYFAIVESEIGRVFYEYGFIASDVKFDQNQFPTEINELVVTRISNHKPNFFISENTESRFFWPELPKMALALGEKIDFLDFYFTPIQMDPIGHGNKIINPYADEKGATYVEPGRHLGYSLTWWGLFFSLIAVYVALHIKLGRIRLKK